MEDILKKVKTILGQNNELVLSVNLDDLSLESELWALGINSLDFIRTIVSLEEEYEIEFSNESLEMSQFRTLGDFISEIQTLRQQS